MKQRTKSIRERRLKTTLKKDFIHKKLHIEFLRQGYLMFGTVNLKPNNEFD